MSKLRIVREFLDKYADTYITIRKHAGDEAILCWLTGVPYDTDDGEHELEPLSMGHSFDCECMLYDEKLARWQNNTINLAEYIIDLSLLPIGYYTHDSGDAMYISQEPERQWKRSTSRRQLTVAHHVDSTGYANDISINALALCVFPPVQVAINDVISGINMSMAINKFYAVGKWGNKGNVCLYYKTTPVGVIVSGETTGTYKVHVPEQYKNLIEDIEQYIDCEVII